MLATEQDPYETFDPDGRFSSEALVRRFAYLRDPKKIAAHIKRERGLAPSSERIERILSAKSRTRPEVGEADDSPDFVVRSLIPPEKPTGKRTMITVSEREAIKRAAAYVAPRKELDQSEIVSLTKKAVKRPRKVSYQPTKTSTQLVEQVAALFGLTPKELTSKSRARRNVIARALVVKLLRERSEVVYSYPRLARIVGRTDHSTAIHLAGRVRDFCKEYPDVLRVYRSLGGTDYASP